MTTQHIGRQLNTVRERIAEAALRSGREPEAVRLVAVTKTFPVPAVLAAWEHGQRDFGESRPREGADKAYAVAQVLPEGPRPVWHMIGHIQRRKAKWVIAQFDIVHSIDRRELAERLSAQAVKAKREIPVLLECNVSGEASKHGYAAAGWEADAATRQALLDEAAAVLALPGLRLEGLMTMAPFVDDAEIVRPVFASLRGLRDLLRERFPQATWPHLSMGMTDDFEVAIEEGATLVRIGRAIFGAREY